MKLRDKLFIAMTVIIVISAVLFISVSNHWITRTFAQLEDREVLYNLNRAEGMLATDLNELNAVADGYAAWDDTYLFMNDPSRPYADVVALADTFRNLRLNAIVLMNTRGVPVFARGYDLEANQAVTPSDNLIKALRDNPSLSLYQGKKDVNGGVLMVGQQPVLVVSRPILTSKYEGPARGFLIMARYLGKTEIGRWSQTAQIPVALRQVSSYRNGMKGEQKSGDTFIWRVNSQRIAGGRIIKDLQQRPILMLTITQPRAAYAQSVEFLHNSVLLLMGIILLVGLSVYFLYRQVVMVRLSEIYRSVKAIGKNRNTGMRIPVRGRDELSSLASGINGMLKALEESETELSRRISYLNTLIDSLNELFLTYDHDMRITFVNKRSKEFWGFEPEEMIGRPIYDVVDTSIQQVVFDKTSERLNLGRMETFELPVICKDGSVITARVNASPIYESGVVSGGIVLAEDVSRRKEAENKLRYLGMHDPLTGLFNRAYFEDAMRRLETSRTVPVGLIVFDLDGLKLMNDTLGHQAGDSLLIEASRLLAGCCRKEDILARVGGDEFAVLLPHSLRERTEGVCQNIRLEIARHNKANGDFPMSLSMGFAVREDATVSMDEIFHIADDNMYREKLHSSRSARASIVQALMKAMEARDYITEGHAERLQDLVLLLTDALDISDEKGNDLRLLAQFHDIGKVGISDSILFKPDKLTEQEATEMKRHCEIGHRIALSAPELAPVAEWILKHHEWWNGKGYPLGLAGNDIPLECRILSIADAFDAMTSDRPYRKAMPEDEALQELERYAGTQFDPMLVSLFVHARKKNHQNET